MIITKKALSRRELLRGMGAALALPLLDAMVPALAAQSKTAAKPLNRFGVMYIPNGMIMNKWTPVLDGPSFELSPTLSSLEPYRNQLLVLSNLLSNQVSLIRSKKRLQSVSQPQVRQPIYEAYLHVYKRRSGRSNRAKRVSI